MRRVEVKLWAGEEAGSELTQMTSLAPMDSRASAKVGEVEDGRAHLRLVCGEKGADLKLEFPMQTEGTSQSGKRLIPAREMLLSCRTPNLEVEVSRGELGDERRQWTLTPRLRSTSSRSLSIPPQVTPHSMLLECHYKC